MESRVAGDISTNQIALDDIVFCGAAKDEAQGVAGDLNAVTAVSRNQVPCPRSRAADRLARSGYVDAVGRVTQSGGATGIGADEIAFDEATGGRRIADSAAISGDHISCARGRAADRIASAGKLHAQIVGQRNGAGNVGADVVTHNGRVGRRRINAFT